MPKIRKAKPMRRDSARGFGDLVERQHITIACDTEFHGPHTLTIQFAARLDDTIFVQVYSSPAVPEQPAPERLRRLLPEEIEAKSARVGIREARRITADLSPATVLADLFGVGPVGELSRSGWGGGEVQDSLTLTLVGHFWRADFFRVFGREFFADLLRHQPHGKELAARDPKLLSFREARGRRAATPAPPYAVGEG